MAEAGAAISVFATLPFMLAKMKKPPSTTRKPPILRQDFARLVGKDPDHLVHAQPACRGLDHQSQTEIVDRSTVVLAVLCEFQAYDTQRKHRHVLRPGLVSLHKAGQQPF